MKIKGSHEYYALLCKCGADYPYFMICGVYSTKKEAQEADKEVRGCVAKHVIKKCSVAVEVK